MGVASTAPAATVAVMT